MKPAGTKWRDTMTEGIRPRVILLLVDYLEMKTRLASLENFIRDMKEKVDKIEGNESFKDILRSWIVNLDAK